MGRFNKEEVVYKGKEFNLYFYRNPMFHEDWHDAEERELVYIGYYVDDTPYYRHYYVFTERENKEIAEEYWKLYQ